MLSPRTSRAALLGASVLLIAVQAASAAQQTDGQDHTRIERGRYLATAADCAACHTDPVRQDRPFAGGRAIETPFGSLLGTNITPDRATGIGNWSDDEFDAAVRHGRRPDGSRLYPAMPYPSYSKMTRQDVLDIRAYLTTVTPVSHRVVSNILPFPFNIRGTMRVWDVLYFTGGEFKPDATKSETWNRGAYLVEGPGHCGACHTPKTMLGGDNTNQALRGGALQGWFAPDITNDTRRGLGGWSIDDIVGYLKTGHNRITAATGPMAEEITLSTSRLTDADLTAMATYLKDRSGESPVASPLPASDPVMTAGSAIYADACSACHASDGNGVPNLFPALAKSSAARASDPASSIRVVLRGARSAATREEPTAPAMPAFGWQLGDAQVAAVLTYIRNAWGAAAPSVSAEDVRKARQSLSARTD